MPLLDVTLAEGRPPEDIRKMITALTDAVESSIHARRETIRVIVRTVPLEHWSNGGVTLRESRSPAAPAGEGSAS